MSTETAAKQPETKLVKVTVTFPISPAGAYKSEVARTTQIGVIKNDAMAHFGVAPDDQHAYYLTRDGVRIADDSTVGDVAEHAGAVKFTLVKELIQG